MWRWVMPLTGSSHPPSGLMQGTLLTVGQTEHIRQERAEPPESSTLLAELNGLDLQFISVINLGFNECRWECFKLSPQANLIPRSVGLSICWQASSDCRHCGGWLCKIVSNFISPSSAFVWGNWGKSNWALRCSSWLRIYDDVRIVVQFKHVINAH